MSKLRLALVVGIVVAVGIAMTLVLDGGEHPSTGDMPSWPGLVEPLLSTDSVGGQVLIARDSAANLLGDVSFGGVVATRLAPGSTRWSPLEQLSAGHKTVGLALDAAGAGRASVAWTEAGGVKTRSLAAGGGWSPAESLSAGSSVRWVGIDINGAGDELVVWRERGRVALVWRAAGEEWKRWLGPATDLRPMAALGEREDGTATARVVWTEGSGEGTAIRLHAVRFGHAPGAADRLLVAQPDIRSFGWDAGSGNQTLAVVHKTPAGGTDPNADATTSTLTTYDGRLGEPLKERWSERSVSPNPAPVVDMNGAASRVAWIGYRLSSDRLSTDGTFYTRGGLDATWERDPAMTDAEPNATLRSLAVCIDAQGVGLVTFRVDDGVGPTVGVLLRVPDGRAKPLRRRMIASRSPVALGRSDDEMGLAALTAGTVDRPIVRVLAVRP